MGHPMTPATAPRRMRYAVETVDGGTGRVMTLSFFLGGCCFGSSDADGSSDIFESFRLMIEIGRFK